MQSEMQRASIKQELDRIDLELAHLKHVEHALPEREDKLKTDIMAEITGMFKSPRGRIMKSPVVATPKSKSKKSNEPRSRQTNETPTSQIPEDARDAQEGTNQTQNDVSS